MTNQPDPERPAGHRRRPSIYRTALGIALATLVAAWLPFSILYINALTKHAVIVAKAGSAPHTASSGAGQPTQPLTPVTTRAS
jgi:hypothetical protein